MNPSFHSGINYNPLQEKTKDYVDCDYNIVIKTIIDSKGDYLGTFDNAFDAAYVYDQEAKLRYGEYAFLNFPGRE